MDELITGGLILYFLSQARNSKKNKSDKEIKEKPNNENNKNNELPISTVCRIKDIRFLTFNSKPPEYPNGTPRNAKHFSNQIYNVVLELLADKTYEFKSFSAQIFFDDVQVYDINRDVKLRINGGQKTEVHITSYKELLGIVPVTDIANSMAFDFRIKGVFKTSSSDIEFDITKRIEDIILYMETDVFDNPEKIKNKIEVSLGDFFYYDPNRKGYFYYNYNKRLTFSKNPYITIDVPDGDRTDNKNGNYLDYIKEHGNSTRGGRGGDNKKENKTGNELLLEKFGNSDKNHGTANTRTGRTINDGTRKNTGSGNGRSSGNRYGNDRGLRSRTHTY